MTLPLLLLLWVTTYTPASDPIHTVGLIDEGLSFSACLTSDGLGLGALVDKPNIGLIVNSYSLAWFKVLQQIYILYIIVH